MSIRAGLLLSQILFARAACFVAGFGLADGAITD
jgi:hypothetical protein